ncbi:hypothetical protein BY458DRAFT_554375 [Sporodiniella umbellata]|nr:hypothetical protein BY458DRAFT_554375 [Sporodiniella umbellata]
MDPLARLQDYAFPAAQRRNSAANAAAGEDWTEAAPWSSVQGEPAEAFRGQQRSMSYSYDWPAAQRNAFHYQPVFSFLDTMCEEEGEDTSRARVRSKSSAAVMDIWGPLKDTAFNRRLSLTPMPPPPILPSSMSPLYTPQVSAGERERMRRFSLAPLTLDSHSPFIPSSSSSSTLASTKNLMAQRRHSLAGPASTMDVLTETVENLAVQSLEGDKSEMNVDEMGKGVKLEVLEHVQFCMVEFKGGRSDVFYDVSTTVYSTSDQVIVEADRGLDLGKVSLSAMNRTGIEQFYRNNRAAEEENPDNKKQEIFIKRIFRQARPDEVALLLSKAQDEAKALLVCQSKIKQKKLSMQVVDAEYQW